VSEIPQNITRDHLLKAIERIEKDGVPANAHSSTYDVVHDFKPYPPKLVVSWANVFANGLELDRSSFKGGAQTECFQLLEKKGFTISEKPKTSLALNSWLLSWNPKNWSAGGEGKADHSLGLKEGDTVDWRCLSKQPKVGDLAYLIRLGVSPKGIVLKGVVIKESFTEPESAPIDTAAKSYITIQVEELRDNCKLGLLPAILLKAAIPEQEWSTQASGIGIKPDDAQKLGELWASGTGKSSLRQFVDWSTLDENFSRNDWLTDYQSYSEKTKQLKESGEGLDKELLDLIWKKPANGIANVQPGPLSNADYQQNIDVLKNFTYQILTKADHETYRTVFEAFQKLKEQGSISKVYRVVINRVFAGLFPERFTTVVSEPKCKKLLATLHKDFQFDVSSSEDWYQANLEIKRCMQEAGLDEELAHKNNIALWMLYTMVHEPSTKASSQVAEQASAYLATNTFKGQSTMMPLNQILYGPPGTGKTYNAINHALKIIDPIFLKEHLHERMTLKNRFDKLANSGRIHFVTFHQSFGYEDFVEGLRANSNEGVISYDVEPGVFKTACLRADKDVSEKLDAFDQAIGSLIELCEQSDERLKLTSLRGKFFSIEYSGGNTFKVFPESTENENPNYVASISNVKKLYLTGSKKDIYNQSYVEGLLIFLKKELGLPEYNANQVSSFNNEPVVLIIDEINRGNISSIFGELITLIEPSKRAGAEEALSVTLPYSKEQFQVPNNLYLIGTMNTADRSLALMDTALRRRFDFIEMMPDIDKLKGLVVQGIDVAEMLSKMNKRTEVLYDREHTLGHAFFMPLLKEDNSEKQFIMLQSIFENKILPLLEEYFFEDWEKIRLVLGDGNKDPKHQFITVNNDDDTAKLFGKNVESDYGVEEMKSYSRSKEALGTIESYTGIYES
jgi:5-methylcytosine-specific restriction protein B